MSFRAATDASDLTKGERHSDRPAAAQGTTDRAAPDTILHWHTPPPAPLTKKIVSSKPMNVHRSLACFVTLIVLVMAATEVGADSEIVISIRYLQPTGTSHAHLYLYREDGKLLRQLTNDNSGQDSGPIFSPDGQTVVFTREKPHGVREFRTMNPLGTDSKKLDAAPDWYTKVRSS